jgi:hypothetical protein
LVGLTDELADDLFGNISANILPVVVSGFIGGLMNVFALLVENMELFGLHGFEYKLQEVLSLLFLLGPT